MADLWTGPDVIKNLAEIYQQLYLKPGEEGAAQYSDVVKKGKKPARKDLSHFKTSEQDSCMYMETPAGLVRAVTFNERSDFEVFLQIMSEKCHPVPIPLNQGGSILDGVINWRKIEAHRISFYDEEIKRGNILPDWNAEFRRFTAEKENYKDALIVLSTGPYSFISAQKMGLEEKQWLSDSYVIRKMHECTHFVCRRMFPEKIDKVWDELVADAVGIYAAFGKYDMEMAQIFLGMKDGVYVDGRLKIYAAEAELAKTAEKIHAVLPLILKESETLEQGDSPFELAIRLEEKKESVW